MRKVVYCVFLHRQLEISLILVAWQLKLIRCLSVMALFSSYCKAKK